MSDREARLARARGYPYPYPGRSFTWRPATWRETGKVGPFDPAMTKGRTPVLAVGSNRAPEQLARKYLGRNADPVPVQHGQLRDFDIVYAAHLTYYGSVPAMLQHAPGTTVELAVTWLDDAQLEIMHATEGNYHFAVIEDVDLAFDEGDRRDEVHLYVGRQGHFVHEDRAIPLAEISARDRPHAPRSTAEVLEIVRARLAPELSSEDFILRLIDDEGYRLDCAGRMAADSVPFGHAFRKKDGVPADLT